MRTPRVSVVIPALNAAPTLGSQLEALARQTYTELWEIVVVDNGSTDDTDAVARSAPTHPMATLRVVREERCGLNIARNAGVLAATADVVAICDADDVVDPGWLAKLTTGVGDRGADIAAGSLAFGLLNSIVVRDMMGWKSEEPRPALSSEFGFLGQVIGCNVAFTRDVWVAVGGFDESMTRGGDDVDFGWRAQLAGFGVEVRPDAVVQYRGRHDAFALFRQYVRDGEGAAHLYRKFRHAGMPRRSISDAGATVLWLLRRGPGLWRGGLEGRGHVIRVAGKQWGRFRGSLRHRVVYP